MQHLTPSTMDTLFYQQLGRKLKEALTRAMSASDALGMVAPALQKEGGDVVGILQGGIHQAYRITEKFLQYRHFLAHTPTHDTTDATAVFNAHLGVAEQLWAGRGVIFFSYADVLQAELDSEALSFIVIELLDNAARYSPLNGEVQVALLAQKNSLLFTISNTMAHPLRDEERKQLGTPFFRGTNAHNVTYGAGLSLACIHHLARLYEGDISHTISPDGQKWTTQLSLPVAGAGGFSSAKKLLRKLW